MLPYRYHYSSKKTQAFFGRRATIRSAASTAAFAMKLLTLRRSDAAAWSTSIRSSSVRYTKVFRPKGSLDRRRDFGEGPFFMAEIVHRRNGETNDARVTPERLGRDSWIGHFRAVKSNATCEAHSVCNILRSARVKIKVRKNESLTRFGVCSGSC